MWHVVVCRIESQTVAFRRHHWHSFFRVDRFPAFEELEFRLLVAVARLLRRSVRDVQRRWYDVGISISVVLDGRLGKLQRLVSDQSCGLLVSSTA